MAYIKIDTTSIEKCIEMSAANEKAESLSVIYDGNMKAYDLKALLLEIKNKTPLGTSLVQTYVDLLAEVYLKKLEEGSK